MLAGAPPPSFPGNRPIEDESFISKWNTDMKYYAKYLIDLCVPWTDESLPSWERTPEGFCALINTWNRKSATFIERQRFRFFVKVFTTRPPLLLGANTMPIGGQN
jgi:hypothetical protein